MRIKLKFSKNITDVPNNLNVVNSFTHQCWGRNNRLHDAPSDYNISRLLGGYITNGGRSMNYPNGGYIIISSVKLEIIEKLINAAFGLNDTTKVELGYGMNAEEVEYINEEFYNGVNYFKTTTSGFILKKPNGDFYKLGEDDVASALKDQIIRKFGKIYPNLNLNDLKIEINNHPSHKVERIFSGNGKNYANICQINVHSNKNVAELIYNYGIGQSCGSGFGCVYTTQHKELYDDYRK